MIKVIIVDDQDILKQGLKMIIDKQEDIEVVALASNGEEAITMCKVHKPDVVLMDMKMPKLSGVEATQIIKQQLPNTKIIVLTTFNDDEYIFDSLKYGASGYLLKDAPINEIIEAIRTVNKGGALLQTDVANKVISQFSKMANKEEETISDPKITLLSDREKEVCKLIARGKNNKEISNTLFITEGTVKNHITSILTKLSLRDRTQIAIYSIKNKI